MSLFIKSKVHLPSSCEKCPFNYADMSTGICTAADKTIDTRTYGRKRHPDCPITELPTPHGRLIDADKLYEPMERNLYAGIGCDPTNIAAVTIYEAPTIIEAEENDEK